MSIKVQAIKEDTEVIGGVATLLLNTVRGGGHNPFPSITVYYVIDDAVNKTGESQDGEVLGIRVFTDTTDGPRQVSYTVLLLYQLIAIEYTKEHRDLTFENIENAAGVSRVMAMYLRFNDSTQLWEQRG